MAKRKTIRVNPLDALVRNPEPDRTGKPSAEVKVQSAHPSANGTRTPKSKNQPGVEASAVPAPAVQVAQPPTPADLISRIESLEKQNVYLTWLVGGAILLVLLL